MSVVDKVKELSGLRKRALQKLKEEIETKQLDIETEKDELLKALKDQRDKLVEVAEDKNKGEEDERIEKMKLENLEKTYNEKVDSFKNNLETIKAIDQIFKIREERKSCARQRLMNFMGIAIAGAGVAFAYGSDTLGTMFNKKTYDAAKTMLS